MNENVHMVLCVLKRTRCHSNL